MSFEGLVPEFNKSFRTVRSRRWARHLTYHEARRFHSFLGQVRAQAAGSELLNTAIDRLRYFFGKGGTHDDSSQRTTTYTAASSPFQLQLRLDLRSNSPKKSRSPFHHKMSFGGQTPTIIVLKEGQEPLLPDKHWDHPPLTRPTQAPTPRRARARSSPTSTPAWPCRPRSSPHSALMAATY